jgi:diaminopimelate decarboxylase
VTPLVEIAEAAGTPVYVYDADLFRKRIARLSEALAGVPHQICYAAKANDALALLRIAAEAGLGADIVSGGELAKALRAGVPADRIVFSGVGKRPDEIRAALEAGVRSLNAESLPELEVVAGEARALGLAAPVSVRLNPDVDPRTHRYVATGSATSKFGLGPEAALEALERAAGEQALQPVGISFHVGSQLPDQAPILAAAGRAADLWRAAKARGIALRDLDVGGGLPVAYDGGAEPDLEGYARALASVAAELEAELVLEPGRWLVGPIGTLLTRVLYVKEAGGRVVAVCDAGMNDLIRPALYGAEHPIEVLDAAGRARAEVDVVGPVCESGDFFALGRELPSPTAGDLLAIGLVGAYGRVMASTYNARPLCAEVLVEDGSWRITRERGTADDLASGEVV